LDGFDGVTAALVPAIDNIARKHGAAAALEPVIDQIAPEHRAAAALVPAIDQIAREQAAMIEWTAAGPFASSECEPSVLPA
jgi:hypothetical protein